MSNKHTAQREQTYIYKRMTGYMGARLERALNQSLKILDQLGISSSGDQMFNFTLRIAEAQRKEEGG